MSQGSSGGGRTLELVGFDLENEGRLTHPTVYDQATDRYLPISWDEALAKIGAALRALPHPDMAEFYTSGRASNEAAFLYQLFGREYGTNNFPDCSNMCHEATSVGLIRVSRSRVDFGCMLPHRHVSG